MDENNVKLKGKTWSPGTNYVCCLPFAVKVILNRSVHACACKPQNKSGIKTFRARHDSGKISFLKSKPSLVLRPVRAIRVSGKGLERSANSPNKFERWRHIRYPKSPGTTGNEA